LQERKCGRDRKARGRKTGGEEMKRSGWKTEGDGKGQNVSKRLIWELLAMPLTRYDVLLVFQSDLTV